MFRSSKSAPETTEPAFDKVGGKGRPTPTRKEAEALAKAKARAPRTRKEQAARQRQTKSESSQKIRAGMKAGDERYLLPRDKGPVRRFIRDFIDSRFSITEFVIPLMLASLFLPMLIVPTFLVLLVDIFLMRRRMRAEIARRFPDAVLKGTTYYAITRMMQLKFMRLPKSKVKLGQELPEHYR